jgi:hypothetical protein
MSRIDIRSERGVDIRELKADFVACQTLLHGWERIPDKHEYLPTYLNISNAARRIFRCWRCTTVRAEVWSKDTFDLVVRQYYYPDGYSLSVGEVAEGMTRRKLARSEYLRRDLG